MPELPEVETTLRGIKPHIIGQKVTKVEVRCARLRWPVPKDLPNLLKDQKLQSLERRGKYLLFGFLHGTLILHLGMSGRLQILTGPYEPKKHDHVDIHFANRTCLRFRDPRRFGALIWTNDCPEKHPLLAHIGLEPLSSAFNGDYLWQQAQKRKVAVKIFIMNSTIVAGIGNIYAIEALFKAKIRPQKPAGKISRAEYQTLAEAIKTTLQNAIKQGGTTLKDFATPSGSPGYFQVKLNVYGKSGEPCPRCGSALKSQRLGQRSTVYCAKCQK